MPVFATIKHKLVRLVEAAEMAKVSNYTVRMQTALLKELERVAKQEGRTIDELINAAVAGQLAALRTESYFKERAAKGNRADFQRILDKAGTQEPCNDDQLP